MSKMTKSEKIRRFIRRHPGCTLQALQAALPGLGDGFIATVVGQWRRKGKLAGDKVEGYFLADAASAAEKDAPLAPLGPKVRGFREAARDAKRAGKLMRDLIVLTPAGADAVQVGGDHYKALAVQPWDAMQAWGTPEEFAGFLKFNAIKYLAREGKKGGVEDVKKARHYLDKLIEVRGV